jgi:hypothetical protein
LVANPDKVLRSQSEDVRHEPFGYRHIFFRVSCERASNCGTPRRHPPRKPHSERARQRSL